MTISEAHYRLLIEEERDRALLELRLLSHLLHQERHLLHPPRQHLEQILLLSAALGRERPPEGDVSNRRISVFATYVRACVRDFGSVVWPGRRVRILLAQKAHRKTPWEGTNG